MGGEALSHVFNNDENKNGGGKLEILARMISNEMGKTLLESREELSDFQSVRKEMLDLVGKANEPVSLSEDCGVIGRIDREPLGTIAIISPWNYPVLEILLHLVPALVAGNAAIVKPSEVTPMSGAMIVEWLKEWRGVSSDYGEIRLPVEIVQGDGEVGKTLVSHEGVHSVSMTGSSVTGRKIMEECGKSLKRVILELGGKDPMVVLSNADLNLAARDAVRCSVVNCGQVCCSVERIYVDETILENFERLRVDASCTSVISTMAKLPYKVVMVKTVTTTVVVVATHLSLFSRKTWTLPVTKPLDRSFPYIRSTDPRI